VRQQNAIKVYNLFGELVATEVNQTKNNSRNIKLHMHHEWTLITTIQVL